MYLIMFNKKHFRYHKAYVTVWDLKVSLSMGQYLFVSKNYNRYLLMHEYGHSFQSLYLGPFYLILVGIPSMIWCKAGIMENYRKRHNISYYDAPFEANANKLGRIHVYKVKREDESYEEDNIS
ncbi:MAG: hypothetical protein Q4D13_01750 [Erysipelotrichaceae bacterium]|nr:hypothetical protein [Erysipelotrichaceae bacterium]